MIKDGVYRLKKDSTVTDGVEFKRAQEIEVIGSVVYMGGYPLPFNMQNLIITWMGDNQNLFVNDTRDY